MWKYSDLQNDTPRLVVMFRLDNGNHMFQWGIVGQMPVLTLVGCIIRVQAELPLLEPLDAVRYSCPESAMVIAWNAEEKEFHWFVHPDIPTDSLIGMLETIKLSIVGANEARRAASQQFILGPDGKPVGR